MDPLPSSSSSDERPNRPEGPLVIPGEARLRFRLRLLVQTRARFLNCVLVGSVPALLGARQACGLLLSCLGKVCISRVAATSREARRCVKGALGLL